MTPYPPGVVVLKDVIQHSRRFFPNHNSHRNQYVAQFNGADKRMENCQTIRSGFVEWSTSFVHVLSVFRTRGDESEVSGAQNLMSRLAQI